jgi:predicted transcriptional regulator
MAPPTSIRLDDAELERVKMLAKLTERSQSFIIRRALRLGLATMEDQLEAAHGESQEGLD